MAYNNDNAYDDNKDTCLRITEAYGAQLAANQTWLEDGTTLYFNFAACSGAKLVDMVDGQQQMSKLKSPTDIIVMTVGGNNAFFFDIATNCIYHPKLEKDGFSYGNPYEDDPDRSGLCAKAIDNARNYIKTEAVRNTQITIGDMLKEKLVKIIQIYEFTIRVMHITSTLTTTGVMRRVLRS